MVYVADGTNDSPPGPSRRARPTNVGNDVLRRLFLVACMLLLVAGCSEDTQRAPVEPSPEDTTSEASSPGGRSTGPARDTTSGVTQGVVSGYTYGLASGNRVVGGEGRLPETQPVDVDLSGTPVWVAGVPLKEDTAWVVTYNDGRIDSFRLDGTSKEVEPWLTAPDHLPGGAPPLLVADEGRLGLVTLKGVSPLTHPVRTDGGLLGVAPDGRLVSDAGEDLPVSSLPDARIVEARNGSLAVLSDPSGRYPHAVLGDAFEAGSIGVLEAGPGGYAVSERVRPESGGVFEALAPLWFRPGGGEEELLAVTESTGREGSRISVYAPDGNLVAAGPFVGEPQSWRHLLAAGPFGPNGEVELAAVRTPHVSGPVEFYSLDRENGELQIVAHAGEYLSHTLYSRNLDAVRAGDLDGDGSWELLLPDASYTALEAVRHTEGGVETVWRLPLGGTLATNLASATDSEGRVALAVGTAEGKLRIWR